jgi:hypothetical protein
MTPGMPWPRCSFVADAAHDPREGSAPPADLWFLIEHPGPWGRIPLAQSGINSAAVAAISAWSTAENGRVVLIRRPGRAARNSPTGGEPVPGAARRWFRVDSRPGHESIRTGTFVDESELVTAVHAPGEPYAGPMALVCTHGRHDTCCAVRGRPVAAAMVAADPEHVWECSHIGGCRFAPAVVLLPHGFVLGGPSPSEAPAVLRDYAAGRLDPQWVRGRSSLPPAVQAAQHHAVAATGATGVDALGLVGISAEQFADGSSGWRVELADPGCTVRLRERRVETGRPLTCAATVTGWMRVFDLVELEVATPQSSLHDADT